MHIEVVGVFLNRLGTLPKSANPSDPDLTSQSPVRMRPDPDSVPAPTVERPPEVEEAVILAGDVEAKRPVSNGRVLRDGSSGHARIEGRLLPVDAPANGHSVNGHPLLHGHNRGAADLEEHGREGTHAPPLSTAISVPWDDFLPIRSRERRWRAAQSFKRGFDVAGAGLVLLLLSPVILAAAIVVRVTSKGPVLYVCDYVGYRGRRFPGFKLRTMVQNAEVRKVDLLHLNHMDGPAFKIRQDPRVTSVGAFLRKYSIDELPQLWNVIRGDMSLVGPRPPLPDEWAQFAPWQRGKLAVIPGITCYWQVGGRSNITSFDEWVRLDLDYIQDWSLWTDLKILIRTIPAVLKGDGAY